MQVKYYNTLWKMLPGQIRSQTIPGLRTGQSAGLASGASGLF